MILLLEISESHFMFSFKSLINDSAVHITRNKFFQDTSNSGREIAIQELV